MKIKSKLLQELNVIRATKLIHYIGFYISLLGIYRSIKLKAPSQLIVSRIDKDDLTERKYLNYRFWSKECLIRYYRLNLHKVGHSLRVLDLGTGFGFFPHICNELGHQAECLDSPESELYREITEAFDLKRYEEAIHAFKRIDLNGSSNKFDLVTAFMICFNNHKSPDLWNIDEWQFFILDLYKNHLNENGSIYLSFNQEENGIFFDSGLEEFFKKNSYVVDGNNVLITHPPKS
ncbi:hypothetical protein OAK29_01970 [Gammaproteobacteria bacterium]|nr:hypothetical protein [Gammaproteobacteria bacterium]